MRVAGLAAAFAFSAIVTAAAATPDYRFVPPQIGDTATYLYESGDTHQFVTLVRTAVDRVTVTITPQSGDPVAFFDGVGNDGLLDSTAKIPQPILEMSSLAVIASGPGSDQRTWTYAPTPATPPVTFTLVKTTSGQATVFTAEGTGYGSAVHIECIFRSGYFVGARGTERAVTYGVAPSQQAGKTWSIAAFATPPPHR